MLASAEAGPSTPPLASSSPKLERLALDDEQQADGLKRYARGENPKLRYIKPYWWPYRTFVKQRCAQLSAGAGSELTQTGGLGDSCWRWYPPSSATGLLITT